MNNYQLRNRVGLVAMEPSFKLTVCPKKRRPFKIDIDYTEETVTSDVLETVEDIYCEIDKSEPNRRWMLYENWMGIGQLGC